MIAFQHVSIFWTKWDRGAEPGARRNALPRQHPFRPPGDPAADWVHHVSYRAIRNPAYDLTEQWAQRLAGREDGLILRPGRDFTEVSAVGGGSGKLRTSLNGLIARVPFGQRLIVRTNGVSDGDHQRYYWEDTYHVGVAETATLDLPLFREIDARVLLY